MLSLGIHKLLRCKTKVYSVVDSFRCASSSTTSLAFDQSGNSGSSSKVAVFMHGLMGSRRNWRTPIREFLRRHPDYRCIAVDCRGHGDSAPLTATAQVSSHTIHSAAADLDSLLKELHVAPDILFGHSLGGKVVLAYIESRIKAREPIPLHTWILDSIPGLYDDKNHNSPNSVSNILTTLNALPTEFVSREYALSALQTSGITMDIATWLCTNLVSVPNSKSLTWCFNIRVMKQFFDDFCKTEMWGVLDSFPSQGEHNGHCKIRVIHAGKNKAWRQDHFDKFKALKSNNIELITMPHVGHWLHADDLHGFLDVVDAHSKL